MAKFIQGILGITITLIINAFIFGDVIFGEGTMDKLVNGLGRISILYSWLSGCGLLLIIGFLWRSNSNSFRYLEFGNQDMNMMGFQKN